MNKFCPNCGNELPEEATFCNKCGSQVNGTQQQSSSTGTPMLTKREIVVAVILSILTCGIYAIYWFIVMTDDANKVSGDYSTSGGMAFLFSILTCGIYGIYWHYKMGQKLYLAGKTYNKDINDNSIIYLILGLFGFGIVSYCLIQNDLNKFSNQ